MLKRFSQAALISLVTVTLLFRGQIAYFSAAQTRYLFPWTHRDAAILMGMILFIALVGLGLYAIVWAFKNRRLENVMGHIWIAVLVFGTLSTLSQFEQNRFFSFKLLQLAPVWHYAWMTGLLALLIVSAIFSRGRTVRIAAMGCLILSPLAVYTVGRIPFWRTWGHRDEVYVAKQDRPDATPVFIFSFDSMSSLFVYKGDEIRKDMPNFRKFAEHANRFPQARSSGPRTGLSLPMMAYQTDAQFKVPEMNKYKKPLAGPSFIVGGKVIPSKDHKSIFATARSAKYQSAFVTFYLPWREILGPNQCDYVHVYDCEPHGEGFWGECYYTLFRNLRYYPYPNSPQIWNRLAAKPFSKNWFDINHQMQDEAIDIIKKSPSNSLNFFHFPLPHAPFVFNSNGSYRGPYKAGRMSGTDEDYEKHLRYTDIVFGKLVKQLKESGKYDNALIIITSDHGWDMTSKTRAARMEPLHHNTLLIKYPNQSKPGLIKDAVANTSLRPIIDLAMKGKLDETSFQTEIAKVIIPPEKLAKKFATKPDAKAAKDELDEQ